MHRSKFQYSTKRLHEATRQTRPPPLTHTHTLTVALSADTLDNMEQRMSSRDTEPKRWCRVW
jgi:hypothetical protein